uniref:Uncharacterized protein n=1 Tax=Myotis myotis TaxID=51298 RepID=A0A7J7SCN8_MYOMY|nr:hypothetical protein mMyoMyo1_009545 [Myotis myotis]
MATALPSLPWLPLTSRVSYSYVVCPQCPSLTVRPQEAGCWSVLHGGSPAPRTAPGTRMPEVVAGGRTRCRLAPVSAALPGALRGAMMDVTCLLLTRLLAWASPPGVTTHQAQPQRAHGGQCRGPAPCAPLPAGRNRQCPSAPHTRSSVARPEHNTTHLDVNCGSSPLSPAPPPPPPRPAPSSPCLQAEAEAPRTPSLRACPSALGPHTPPRAAYSGPGWQRGLSARPPACPATVGVMVRREGCGFPPHSNHQPL